MPRKQSKQQWFCNFCTRSFPTLIGWRTHERRTHGVFLDKHGERVLPVGEDTLFQRQLRASIIGENVLLPATTTQVVSGGSTRSVARPRYDLISKAALDALGRRAGLGAEKHGENNWRKSLATPEGRREFRIATINHLLDHIFDYAEHGNKNDDNTAAIICNAAFLCEYEAEEKFIGHKES